MALFHDSAISGASGNQGGGVGYQISRSLRFNSSDSAYLSRTPASAGNRKTWTWAGWVKRSKIGGAFEWLFSVANSGASNTDSFFLGFDDDQIYAGSNSSVGVYYAPVYRDPSAWFHLVLAVETDNATAADRYKLYVNGTRITAVSSAAYPSQSTDTGINRAAAHYIGSYSTSDLFNGYLADVHFIDGQALDPSSFVVTSATTGQLIPKAYIGTFTGNSFWLKFADNSAATATTLGKDSSGLGNNWTPNNLSVTAGAGNDSLVDTPTSYGTDDGLGGSVRGNYCTWNPLLSGTKLSVSNGNLDYASATTGAAEHMIGTFMMPAVGKWYFEVTPTSFSGANGSCRIGISRNGSTSDNDIIVYNATGDFETYGSTDSAPNSYTQNDIIGVAVDFDADSVTFYKNNVSEGSKSFGGSDQFTPYVRFYRNSGTMTGVVNFGQRPFAYTAPSGFKALCDTNLPAPVVAQPSTVMDVKLWTGNGAARSISTFFSPDFVWIKQRNSANNHVLFDVVRTATKGLHSDLTDAEFTDAATLTAFNSDGFSIGTHPTVNTNGSTYVAWAWDAGSSTVTNTQGSITSSVRANASAGFSIVTYTGKGSSGQTIGHGLGVTPALVIIKNRTDADTWWQVHGNGFERLQLNTTQANLTDGYTLSRTSTTISPTGNAATHSFWNASGKNYVAYCWAPVTGYSSFGSYTGNGVTDGPFVYTGFRPRWILFKENVAGIDWLLIDVARDPYNKSGNRLFPNTSGAEDSSRPGGIDILSNGFKIRDDSRPNPGNYQVVYAAFAESPFQYARAR